MVEGNEVRDILVTVVVVVVWLVVTVATIATRTYTGEREVFFNLGSGWEATVLTHDAEAATFEGNSDVFFDASEIKDGELVPGGDSFHGDRLARDSFRAEGRWESDTTYRMTAGYARITATSESGLTAEVGRPWGDKAGLFLAITLVSVILWLLILMVIAD